MRCSSLIRKIIPEHCTILKTTFEEISFWPWKCKISFKITKIIIDVIIVEFCKGCSQMRVRLLLYIRVAFTCVPGFEVFPFHIIKHIYQSVVI